MSRLNVADRVDGDNGMRDVVCMWFAKCTNPANGLRDHPILGDVPICQRCDDKIERLSS